MKNICSKLVNPCGQNGSFSLCLWLKSHPKYWMLFDIVTTVLSLKIAYMFYGHLMLHHFFLAEYFCFPIFFLIAGSVVGFYEKSVFSNLTRLFLSLFVTAFLAVAGLALLENVVLYKQVNRHVLVLIFIVNIGFIGLVRSVFSSYAKHFVLRVLFVGDVSHATNFAGYFERDFGYYAYVGCCNDDSQSGSLRLGGIDSLGKICAEQRIDFVVVEDDYISRARVFDKSLLLVRSNCVVMDEETFIEHSFEQVVVDKIDPFWFYRANLGVYDNFQWSLKRVIDIFCATIGLCFMILIYPIIWIAIKLNSAGPVIYSQWRCGLFDKEFKIYKFRTMKVDAEANGAVWARENDERVTTVGSMLRKTRLDELPQFWNILIGDMSLVGPRPERPEFVKKIEEQVPYFCFRHFIKPGLTGFAQIKYRYGASTEDAKEKLKYDLYYVKNWSIFMDIRIILQTIVTVMKGSR